MAVPKSINQYEVRSVLGRGGMGVVYRAYDPKLGREVAVKTIKNMADATSLKLFERETLTLRKLSHPNIVEIYDIGEFEEDGEKKPFFVMSLLRGTSLDQLVGAAGQRLAMERTVEIVCQVCKGLQAAHETGLVHRDLKPNNIFVLSDDSVKIIDFGVAQIADSRSSRTQRGTLLYMSPEQLEGKPATALSDIFSLGVVLYEALTGRRPFERKSEDEIIEAIERQMPPPAMALNPGVTEALSRVTQKALAKQPRHRFETARDLGETLRKAYRNELIEMFSCEQIQPRVDRARKAYESGHHEFALEILDELGAEGHISPEISMLARQTRQAVRELNIRRLIDQARKRLEADEEALALQKIEEALGLESDNTDALGLKATVEHRRSLRIESWLRLGREHLENDCYDKARRVVADVLRLQPNDPRALTLSQELDQREQESARLGRQMEQLYQAAEEARNRGEIDTAISKMDSISDLPRRGTETYLEQTTVYQSFLKQLHSEREAIGKAYALGRGHLDAGRFDEARNLCDQNLSKYPNQILFKSLKFDIEEQRRQARSKFIAQIDERLRAESDLAIAIVIVEEALAQYPGEEHFAAALKSLQERQDLVISMVVTARLCEEREQYAQAENQWETLRTIYPQYSGLDDELERLRKRRQQQARVERKKRLVEAIDRDLQLRKHKEALEALEQAMKEFSGDSEFAELDRIARQELDKMRRVEELLHQGEKFCRSQQFEEAVTVLRQAHEVDAQSRPVIVAFGEALAQQARVVLDDNCQRAEELLEEALNIDPGHPAAESTKRLIEDRKRDEEASRRILVAQLHESGDMPEVAHEIETATDEYPQKPQLMKLREGLTEATQTDFGGDAGHTALQQPRRPDKGSQQTSMKLPLVTLGDAQTAVRQHSEDQEIQGIAADNSERISADSTVQAEYSTEFSDISLDSVEPAAIEEISPDETTFLVPVLSDRTKRQVVVVALIALATLGSLVLLLARRHARSIASHAPRASAKPANQPPALANTASQNPTKAEPPPSEQPVATASIKPGGRTSRTRAPKPPQPGELRVTSNVEGATILVDGKTQPDWLTPHTFNLPTGKHVISILKPGSGYETNSTRVLVEAGKQTPLSLLLSKPKGLVHITTDPSGLPVYLDGRLLGISPIDVPVEEGSHVCMTNLSGVPYEHRFRMMPGSYGECHLGESAGSSVSSVTGVVRVRTVPEGASVILDGHLLSRATPTSAKVPAGQHTINISVPGCQPVQRTIEVAAGQESSVNEALKCH